MKKPDWYVRLHNPGRLFWWPGYLAWRWFKICWIGHPLRRVELLDDCDMFWDAEEFGMQLRRNPGLWDELESVELVEPMEHDLHELKNHGIPTGYYVCANLECALSLAWPDPWIWHEDLPIDADCPRAAP